MDDLFDFANSVRIFLASSGEAVVYHFSRAFTNYWVRGYTLFFFFHLFTTDFGNFRRFCVIFLSFLIFHVSFSVSAKKSE